MRKHCFLVALCGLALASVAWGAPVIPDYTYQLVDSKPGVIAGFSQNYSYSLALTAPNPIDTGQGVGYQYLAVDSKPSNYSDQVRIYHRDAVVAYDDVNSQNAFIMSIAHANNSGHDGRKASVEGVQMDIYRPMGRMTYENYWPRATGGSTGPYREWQPRDARAGATYNQYLIYPDSDPGADGLGVHHTTTASNQWGQGGGNDKGTVYAETLNAGTAQERNRFFSYSYHYSSGAWGSGMFELGPYTAGADPMQDLGTRPILTSKVFMNQTEMQGLVSGVDDAFRGWFQDETYLYFLTAGASAGDANTVFLSAVEITDWAAGTWSQVDVSANADLYQTFTFDSGSAATDLTNATGLVFASDPDNPAGPPLLYMANGKNRIFVLEVVPEPATMALLALGVLPLLRRKRR